MASNKTVVPIALFLALNLVFFSGVSATCPCTNDQLNKCSGALTLLNIILGAPACSDCCSLLGGLTNLEAAECLCASLKLCVFGIPINLDLSIAALLTNCNNGHSFPSGYHCS